MVKAKNGKKKRGSDIPKISYYIRPEKMKLEEWQIALRRQAAQKETFAISPINEKQQPGSYTISNFLSNKEYKVVFRGEDSSWNYCSCMDFKTSQLGVCKHIEAIKLWIQQNKKQTFCNAPSYTSMYLSYKGDRKVCLRIGSDNSDEFKALAEPYFTDDGVMKPEACSTISIFLRKARQLNDTFRCYPDAINFILEQLDRNHRTSIIENKYSGKELNTLLKTTLYPYQIEGIRFAFSAGKSIIADEMGLGKTIQAIGTAELLREEKLITSVLILCPTSLKYQWKREIERFTNSTAIVIEGNHLMRRKQYDAPEFYKIVSYNSACNDIKILKSLHTDMLIMDEVQRLKNWKTQISKAVKRIDADYSVVLSGTPLENKLEELYSVMQFVDQYCLGPYYKFMDNTVIASETGRVTGYKNLNEVGKMMSNVLIRRRKCDVALQLPERIDKILFVPMTNEQLGIHEECKTVVAQLVAKWGRNHFLSEKDRKRLLLLMGQMRMVCDSTYILDQKSRFDTKVAETINILQNIFESGDEKVVIFSQWERMTRLIAQELDNMDIRYEYLHGGVPSIKRRELTQNFTYIPESKVFISTDAGSTGLNLQVASIVINLDLPWNPAVLEQRIARIYRIGQKRNIQVLNLVSSGTIEERMLTTLNFKTSLFEGILDNGEDSILLDDSKFDKMMNAIITVVDKDEQSIVNENSVPSTEMTDIEEVEKKPLNDDIVLDNLNEEELIDFKDEDEIIEEEKEQREEEKTATPQQLISQGFSFFAGLAKALSSPEETKKLVDSLVKEDKESGKMSLQIPITDKESVSNVLNVIGKLFETLNQK